MKLRKFLVEIGKGTLRTDVHVEVYPHVRDKNEQESGGYRALPRHCFFIYLPGQEDSVEVLLRADKEDADLPAFFARNPDEVFCACNAQVGDLIAQFKSHWHEKHIQRCAACGLEELHVNKGQSVCLACHGTGKLSGPTYVEGPSYMANIEGN